MTLILANRVKEVTLTEGIGDILLFEPVNGFKSFQNTFSDGDCCYYTIESQVGGLWEVGLGFYISRTNSIRRQEVFSSSANNGLVSFIEGTKHIFITYPSEKSVYLDQNNHIVGNLATQTFSGLLSPDDKQHIDTLYATNSGDQQLITIDKTEIINNSILLPSKPSGDILFKIAIVYSPEGVVEYDNVSTLESSGKFYAILNESVNINGLAVVSYLT